MEKLTILHVTDVHSAYDMIENLRQFLIEKNEKIDVILLSGDIGNMIPELNSNEEEVLKCEIEIKNVLLLLQSISSSLLFIPGNHDCVTFFNDIKNDNNNKEVKNAINIHNSFYRITEGLSVIGFGGSVPATRNGINHWTGYPYENQEDMQNDFNNWQLKLNNEKDLSPSDKIIMMTHCGPTFCDTTIDFRDISEAPIHSGSSAVRSFITSPLSQEKVIVNIHGHTHSSQGMSNIGLVKVVNGGPLKYGQFALLSLEKKESIWSLRNVNFFTL